MSLAWNLLKPTLKLLLQRGVYASYAQTGEDIVMRNFIDSKQKGFYVDVGAYHPIQYSNTYSFYRQGWRGLVIDPNPVIRLLFRCFRPRDEVHVAGVSETREEKTYTFFEDGAYNSADPTAVEHAKQKGVKVKRTEKIPFQPLAEILQKRQITNIDILSIDVEGMDLAVLRSHDWTIPTKIIAVESHPFTVEHREDDPIYTFLREKGYALKAMTKLTLVFVKEAAPKNKTT